MSSQKIWKERFQKITERNRNQIQRSLVDLALFGRHEYWNIEALDSAIQEKGIEEVVKELKTSSNSSVSTTVLADALEETAIQLRHWKEGRDIQRFLTLWRDRCWGYGWKEFQRQTEGLLFDYRLSSIQREAILPHEQQNAFLSRLISTLDGKWLIELHPTELIAWSPHSEEKESWGIDEKIASVLPIQEAEVLIVTVDGGLHFWDIAYQLHRDLEPLNRVIHSAIYRSEKLALWSDGYILIADREGELKISLPFPSLEAPSLAISKDGARVMACDGRNLGVWSIATGKSVYQLNSQQFDEIDERDMATSILDVALSDKGLWMMDQLQIWGLRLRSQYDLLRSLSEPMVISEDETRMVAGAEQDLALLEWDAEEENYAILGHLKVPDLWSVGEMHCISPDCRYVVAKTNQGLVAWDLLRQKEARFPVPMTFSARVAVLSASRLIIVDDGKMRSIFRFLAD